MDKRDCLAEYRAVGTQHLCASLSPPQASLPLITGLLHRSTREQWIVLSARIVV